MAFFEFNIAMSGLFAAQRGMQVTSNNITNVNTKGYSRQVLSQQASTPLSGIGVGMTGTGVSVTGVNRVRDSYIDMKLWSQNPKLGEYNIKVTQNSVVESAFGEPSDTGFTAVFDDLFSGISNLSTNPSSDVNKVALKEQMVSFTKYYNNITSTLENYQQNLNFDLKNTVNEINNLSTRIQSLNAQIMNAEIYGDEASSFRDERDNCIDRLSEIIDIEVQETEYEMEGNTIKKLTVKAAGQTLVDHLNYNTLKIEVRGQVEKKIDTKISELVQAYKDLDAAAGNLDKITECEKQIAKTLDELSKLNKNISIEKDASGVVTSIGFTCRNGEEVKLLTIDHTQTDVSKKYLVNSAGDGKLNEEEVTGLYDIVWSNGMSFDMADTNMSGELKGIIDMRDGCGIGEENNYSGIPYYIKRMNSYVQQFAKTMNEEYSKTADGYIQINEYSNNELFAGSASYVKKDSSSDGITFYDSNNNPLATVKKGDTAGKYVLLSYNKDGKIDKTSEIDEEMYDSACNEYLPKYAMFTYTTGGASGRPVSVAELDYSQMTAINFSISKEIFEDPTSMRTLYDESNPSDTSFMLNLLGQKDNKDMYKEGDPKDYMIAIFAELGINAKEAEMYQGTQASVVRNLTNQRLSVSQVDVTEEFTYLIQYQQAYQAAAKMMNTIDGIYETTIFKLGNF